MQLLTNDDLPNLVGQRVLAVDVIPHPFQGHAIQIRYETDYLQVLWTTIQQTPQGPRPVSMSMLYGPDQPVVSYVPDEDEEDEGDRRTAQQIAFMQAQAEKAAQVQPPAPSPLVAVPPSPTYVDPEIVRYFKDVAGDNKQMYQQLYSAYVEEARKNAPAPVAPPAVEPPNLRDPSFLKQFGL